MQVTRDVQFESEHSKVSGTLYLEGEDHLRLLSDAYAMFAHTNPMHGDVFPSVRRMEAEVVNMTASLLGRGALLCPGQACVPGCGWGTPPASGLELFHLQGGAWRACAAAHSRLGLVCCRQARRCRAV